ncbi:MAG: hypothetical protein ABI317_05710 [Gaiellales bacterium]
MKREPVACALIAACCALTAVLVAPPAQDLAAHVYRAALVDQGVVLWDNYWYAGDYPLVSYSVLAPVLAALVGVAPLVVASTAASGGLFALIAAREWGGDARWPARAFAVAAALPLLPGLDAYALGVPLLLGAVAALQRSRRVLALACAALTLLTSPLAFVFLLGIVASVALSGRCDRQAAIAVGAGLGALAALEAVIALLLFPTTGVYPFLIWHLLAVTALAISGMLLAYRDRTTRPIAWLLCAWAVSSLASYLVANPIGDNLARLRYAVFPLILLLAVRRRQRRIATVVAIAALVYAAAPDLIQVTEQADARSATFQVWAPTVDFLHHHLPLGARVEVVPTSARWEAYYLPSRGIPLARGWYRQIDLARNDLLYRKTVAPVAYRRWLARTAVQYVVLTPFPLDDHGAAAEARLLRSGRSGLRVAWRRAGFTIYVTRARAHVITGAAGAQLTAFKHERIAGTVRRAGLDSLKVSYSPYWHVAGAATCVVRARNGMSIVEFDRAGAFSLSITLDPITIARHFADPDC